MRTRVRTSAACFATLFATLLAVPLHIAYAQSAAQKAACDASHVVEVCDSLVSDFESSRGGSTLLLPGDVKVLNRRLARVAFEGLGQTSLTALRKQYEAFALQAISTRAAVTQVGSESSGTGSTNLVSKPTTTDLISLAAESGAFTETQNGTSVTLQANANGLAKYFANQEIFVVNRTNVSALLQPLNFTVSLNVAQSSGTTAATSGSATSQTPSLGSVLLPSNNTSFSAFQARYNLYRPGHPNDATFYASFLAQMDNEQALLDSATGNIATAVNSMIADFTTPSAIAAGEAWKSQAAAAESAHDFNALVQAYSAYTDTMLKLLRSDPGFAARALALGAAVRVFEQAAAQVFDEARGTPLATVTYGYSTPVSLPAQHDVSTIVSYLFKGGRKDEADGSKSRTFLSGAQFTGNFAVSLYANMPAGAVYGRLRDTQLSAEFDKPFGGTKDDPRATVSLAGYGQYQYDPTVLNITAGNLAPGTNIVLKSDAQVLLGTAGWTGVAQGKITVNLSRGLSLPIALKWSNRTDLVQANNFRGQFGLSYDLSALSSLVRNKLGLNPATTP